MMNENCQVYFKRVCGFGLAPTFEKSYLFCLYLRLGGGGGGGGITLNQTPPTHTSAVELS